jgi:hypothetical protein
MPKRLLSGSFHLALAASLVLGAPKTGAQVYSNDEGAREAIFVTKVVELDEFIHRFNNDSSSAIRAYYLSHRRSFDKSREALIRSLFNYTTQKWDSAQIDRFVRCVTDPEHPEWLGFLRDNWYAEARCSFRYQESVVDIPLVLKIQLNPDHTAEWVIAAVKPALQWKESPPVPEPAPQQSAKRHFIQPAANDTYFAELDKVLSDKRHLADILDTKFFHRHYSAAFFQALVDDKLKFIAVRAIKYHYLQVHDWIFTVENFDRSTRNSGWLISSIRPVNAGQRSEYEKKLLEE